jgi:hypothetical protein
MWRAILGKGWRRSGFKGKRPMRQLNDPKLYGPLQILEDIATARGDASSATEYRRRAEAAYAEAQQRAGRAGLDPQLLAALLQLALHARAQQLPLLDALRAAGAEDPAALIDQIAQNEPWLATHLQALATNQPQPQPQATIPTQHAQLLTQAWQAAETQ